MDLYKELLKILKSGRSALVLLDTETASHLALNDKNLRLRLVSPNDCQYLTFKNRDSFTRSCFAADDNWNKLRMTPDRVVKVMAEYDAQYSFKLLKVEAI